MTDAQIIDGILDREGDEYTNRPNDRGGPTKWGITIATLSEWLGRPATIAEVQNLARTTAWAIYHANYITRPRFNDILNPLVRELAIDTGVNHGQRQAAKWLQKVAINSFGAAIVADGVIGPKTLAVVNAAPGRRLFYLYLRKRIAGYADIVQNDPRQLENLEGWNDRAASFIERLV